MDAVVMLAANGFSLVWMSYWGSRHVQLPPFPPDPTVTDSVRLSWISRMC